MPWFGWVLVGILIGLFLGHVLFSPPAGPPPTDQDSRWSGSPWGP